MFYSGVYLWTGQPRKNGRRILSESQSRPWISFEDVHVRVQFALKANVYEAFRKVLV
jgi:predicted nucleic acid-binding OB-fold protein